MSKIGFIDSGIGGLSLLNDFFKLCNWAEVYYISDENNVPYGGKDQGFMFNRTCLMVDKLLGKGAEHIIIACNTLTAETIDQLRMKYNVNFFGIEPYINYLNKENVEDHNNIGLILTPATSQSSRFQELVLKFDPNKKIKIYPLPKLALIIENIKNENLKDLKLQILEELSQVRKDSISRLILGCTHYPLIKNFLEKELELQTIDPHKQVVEHILKTVSIPLDKRKIENFYYNANLSDNWELKSKKWITDTFYF